jgi:hypothetical protein
VPATPSCHEFFRCLIPFLHLHLQQQSELGHEKKPYPPMGSERRMELNMLTM